MSELDSCLAVLAVAATSKSNGAKAAAIDAIDHYAPASAAEPSAAIARVRSLAAAFDALKLDGGVSLVIREALQRRIEMFESQSSDPGA